MHSKKLHLLEIGKSTAGVGEYLRWLANGLDKTDFELTFACMSEGGPELAAELAQIDGVDAFSIPMQRYKIAPLSDLRALLRLRRTIRAGKFDLIHAHASKPGFLGRLAAAGTGIPVIYSPHCFAFHEGTPPHVARVVAFFERHAARWLTHKIITVATAEVELAQRYRVGKPDQFITIHSGIDAARFAPPEAANCLHQTLQISGSPPLAGVVGRLSKQKNPLLFVRAAARVHATLPQAQFVWIGTGPLAARAKSLARQLGIAEQVHFMGMRADVPQLLPGLDVFVLCSDWEAFPLTILEAMAAARPVVATNVMGVSEIVVHEKSGLLVPPGDAAALANAMLKLLTNPADAQKMGFNGLERVKRRFTRQQMLANLSKAYHRTVANS